jgi:hypothetical protein
VDDRRSFGKPNIFCKLEKVMKDVVQIKITLKDMKIANAIGYSNNSK